MDEVQVQIVEAQVGQGLADGRLHVLLCVAKGGGRGSGLWCFVVQSVSCVQKEGEKGGGREGDEAGLWCFVV